MKKFLASAALIALVTAGVSGFAQAQTTAPTSVTPPPTGGVVSTTGVGQVDQRLGDQQKRIDAGVKDGQIGAKQEMRDEKTDAHVSQELSKDEAKNGGVITKAEQKKMNKQLNKNSKRIHRQRVKGAGKVAPVTTAPVSQ